MFDYKNLNTEARQYFDQMPGFLKENIAQGGMTFTTKEELQAYQRAMMEQGRTYNPS